MGGKNSLWTSVQLFYRITRHGIDGVFTLTETEIYIETDKRSETENNGSNSKLQNCSQCVESQTDPFPFPYLNLLVA